MKPHTHRAALRAAARLALPFGLAGCGASLAAAPSTDGAVSDGARADGGPSDVSVVSPDVVTRSCEERDPSRSQRDEALCCERLVHAAIEADAGVGSPSLLECCGVVARWYDLPENRAATWPTSRDRDVCCGALGWQGSLTCTPWGPPVPPSGAGCDVASESGAWLDLRSKARLAAPTLPALPGLYESARATWLERMVNEHESSSVFEALSAQLRAAGFGEAPAEACLEFAREEREHGVLCGAVVEALGGEALAPSRAHPDYPRHPEVDAREAALRNVLSVCCLSETVAVALIGAERIEMSEGPLRELLTRILADEVGHARFGWTLLREVAPTLSEASRARLGDYLSLAFAHLESHELAHLPLDANPPAEAAALGLCNGRDARALFFDTVSEVIVPALEAMSLPAAQAWARRASA